MSQDLNLKIADIVFTILPTGFIKGFSLDKTSIPFKTGENNPPMPPFFKGGSKGGFSEQKADIVLTVKRQSLPRIRCTGCRFDASTWDYFQANERHIFNFSYSSRNKRPQRILVLEPDFKRGEIILPKVVRNKNGVLRNPFAYPLDQVLTITLLYQKQGILVHSCGFVYEKKGYIFIGSSGAGKSTLAKILEKDKGVLILSDDRIVVRKKDECFYIHGTPWHGTAGIVSPEKAPLRGLFFLKKDERNLLQRLSVLDTVSRLIKCSFPPFWDKVGIASTLKICEDIATSIPCFEFSFLPDNTALEMIKERFLIS